MQRVKPAKKKQRPSKSYVLIWVSACGKSRRGGSWTKKALKIVGIYGSKASAQAAKQQLMSEHDCCGHGDILVGDSWEDEIDLVIREAPLFLE